MADQILWYYFLFAIFFISITSSSGQQACFKDPTITFNRDPATSFRVSWRWDPIALTPPACNFPAELVIVRYILTNRDQCEEIISPDLLTAYEGDGSVRYATLEDLYPYSTYTIYIGIRSNGKDIQVTQFVNQTSNTKPGPPRNVRAAFKTAASITYDWQSPVCGERGADITEYVIRHSKRDRPELLTYIEQRAENLFYTALGLLPNTVYNFTLQSKATVPSDPVEISTRTLSSDIPAPSSVDGQVINGNLRFTWNPVNCVQISCSSVDRYYYKLSGDNENVITGYTQSSQDTEITIGNNLQRCVEYIFVVAADTNVGIGAFSDPISASVEGLPKPSNLRAPNADLNSITVEWDPPKLSGVCADLKVTNYVIEYGINERGYETITVVASTNRHDLTSLTSYSTYVIRLLAKGEDGMESPWSEIKKVTKEGVSSEPRNLTATEVTTNSVTLEWDTPLNPNGVLKYYEIASTGQTDEDDDSLQTIISRINIEYLMSTLKNLEPDSTYNITVRANKESEDVNGKQATISVTTKGRSSSASVVGAGVAGGIVVILIIIVVVVIILRRVRRKQNETIIHGDYVPSNTMDTLPLSEYVNLGAGGQPLDWDIQWTDLQIHDKILGEGNFGVVQEGKVRIGNAWITVAVKTLPDGADKEEVKGFENELAIMKNIGRHMNIVSLVGSCRFGDMLYVALEHVNLGNLKNFLKESRTSVSGLADDGVNSLTDLSHAQLISFALDVAKGMEFLADHEIIHRDLAARNVLIDGQGFDGYIAKVCDFGMSRGDRIYRQSSNTRVPVKWTAIEALTRQIYTTYSDVWSFGILLWEIVTIGGTPYTNPKIETRDLVMYLQTNYRLEKPKNCDQKMYDLMFQCWAERPASRPTFTDLKRKLGYILDDESVYVITSIDKLDEFRFVEIDPDDD